MLFKETLCFTPNGVNGPPRGPIFISPNPTGTLLSLNLYCGPTAARATQIKVTWPQTGSNLVRCVQVVSQVTIHMLRRNR